MTRLGDALVATPGSRARSAASVAHQHEASTGYPSGESQSHVLGAWPDAPSISSAPTSDRLTPDSESEGEVAVIDDEDDDDGPLAEGTGLLGSEAYELQSLGTRDGRRSPKSLMGDYHGSGSGEDSGARTALLTRRTSVSTTASFQLYTPDEEQAVVRKFDRRLVLFVAMLYMLSFLDRSNIGNARIAGMDVDLQSFPPQEGWYEWSLTAFYLAYIAFEWMSLLWKIIPAHIYVSIIVLSWGLTASLQAVVVNYPMLIFLRLLLGIGEAAFTGIPFYLSFFFKRHELAFRTALFISAAPLATSFASSLSWLIIKLARASPIAPWRLLFLLEGFPSVFIAVFAWSIIPDSPQTAPYLTARERKVARLRLRHDKPSLHNAKAASRLRRRSPTKQGLDSRDALGVFGDPVAWLTAFILFLSNLAYSSLPVFLPTILTAMGHSPESAQALAAPPYLTAFLMVLATARASDGMRARAPFLIAHALASAVGYGILALADSSLLHLEPGSIVRYLAVYPAAVGFFNVVVLTIAWNINNQRTESRQGSGFALMQLIGQCGPLVGTRLYPDAEAPYYTRGMSICAVAMLGVALLATVLRWWLGRLNKQLDRQEAAGALLGVEGPGEEEGLVDGSGRYPRTTEKFRYML